jgi:glycosyltransferase involved in cell wall biosynthesis
MSGDGLAIDVRGEEPGTGPDPSRPFAFLVSTTGCASDLRRHLGSADYSYGFVLKAIAPALERLGTWRLVERPESSLSYLAARARSRGLRPIHLVLHPPQNAYFSPDVPNVLFPFWEFPQIPARDFGFDTRQNWRSMCRGADLILTACRFTAEAFREVGVTCPVEVVPVPLAGEAFGLPSWDPDWSWTITCRHHVLGGDPQDPLSAEAVTPARQGAAVWKRALRAGYRRYVRRWLNDRAIERVKRVRRAVLRMPDEPLPLLPSSPLTLSGLVFTSLFNPSDRRKNARDILTAFLVAFRDRPDATLVLKLATSATREYHDMMEFGLMYERLGLRDHRCRVVLLTDYLSDEQMMGLFRATTYYVNASKAEGACLPLQQALAAGRPAIAPAHTAMADYVDDRVGFVVRSHHEPTFWPHDPEKRTETYWHRLVWSDLRDHMLEAASVARRDRARYDALSAEARGRMADYAGLDVVAERLGRALASLECRPAAGGHSLVPCR